MRNRIRPQLCAVLIAATLAAASAPAASAAGAGHDVDFRLFYDAPVVAASGSGTQTFTVDNAGADATGAAVLAIALPAFVRTGSGPLPAGCSVSYTDRGDPAMPEVLGCVLPPLKTGQNQTLPVPITVADIAPGGVLWGTGTVLPAAQSTDIERNASDNSGTPSATVNPARPPRSPAQHATDLYLTTDLPALASGRSHPEVFTAGNRGPGATSGPVRLALVTPPFVRVDHTQPLPDGCEYRLTGAEPAAPEVVRCRLSRVLAPGAETTVPIPLTAEPGAPVQTLWGIANVMPDPDTHSVDTDPVLANNTVSAGAQAIG
ncbi:hypothetical protein [Amycolatopsis sp. NPDC054798]